MLLRLRSNRVTFLQTLRDQLAQITLPRVVRRRIEHRVMQLAELDLEVAFLRHFQRVGHRFRRFAEARLHLFGGAEIKLLRLIVHPLRVRELSLGADANKTIVRVRMPFLHVMNIVRRNQLQPEFLRPRNQNAGSPSLAPANVMRF